MPLRPGGTTVGMAVLANGTRARNDIIRLVHGDLGLHALAGEIFRVLERVIRFDGTCLLTMDPATMLPTGEVVTNGLERDALVRLAEIEQREPDVNKFTALARSGRPAASLSAATGGRLDRSLRQRELRRPQGFDDELRVVCSDETGAWGAITLLREAGRPPFTEADVGFVASIAGIVADGLRHAVFLRDSAGGNFGETGVLVLGSDNGVELANRTAEHWLDLLSANDAPGGELPVVVLAVAARTRRLASGHSCDGFTHRTESDGAHARVQVAHGRWVVVRGSLLGEAPSGHVAILLEEARPSELAPLIADAYHLTPQERAVTELAARGSPTNDIAARLHISAYTVQDHLKSIFEKTGTTSRGDLVARLFFNHYAPRLSTPAAPGPDGPT